MAHDDYMYMCIFIVFRDLFFKEKQPQNTFMTSCDVMEHDQYRISGTVVPVRLGQRALLKGPRFDNGRTREDRGEYSALTKAVFED